MNYTANYHLPKWVESDRIMMDDFNQMCENIDAGLTENARATEKVSQDGGAQNKLLADRLFRLEYNHYLALQAANPFPQQLGMFYQNAVRDLTSEAGVSWDGARFKGSGTSFFVIEPFFQDYVKVRSNLMMDKDYPANSRPLEAEICTPSSGKVENFNLSGNYSNNVPKTPAPFLLTVNNLDTGEVEQSCTLDLMQPGTSGSLNNNIQPVTLRFYGGVHYLLKIEPIGDPVFTSNITFTYGSGTQLQGIGQGSNAVLNISHTMQELEESSIGLLILRCRAGGLTGKLTVQWDGKTMQPEYIHPWQNEYGLEMKEMIYVRREQIPAETSFSVNFVCGESGAIWFQDWGVILI